MLREAMYALKLAINFDVYTIYIEIGFLDGMINPNKMCVKLTDKKYHNYREIFELFIT